ncbi:MAG TPA: hypothetical protein VFZ66_15720 [Herpetosiphonaceae bacterium]
MDPQGILPITFFLFLLNLTLLIAWVVLTALGLQRLRRLPLSEAQYLLWTLVVLLIPVFGSVVVLLRTSAHHTNTTRFS